MVCSLDNVRSVGRFFVYWNQMIYLWPALKLLKSLLVLNPPKLSRKFMMKLPLNLFLNADQKSCWFVFKCTQKSQQKLNYLTIESWERTSSTLSTLTFKIQTQWLQVTFLREAPWRKCEMANLYFLQLPQAQKSSHLICNHDSRNSEKKTEPFFPPRWTKPRTDFSERDMNQRPCGKLALCVCVSLYVRVLGECGMLIFIRSFAQKSM